jgi:hypothetical protein
MNERSRLTYHPLAELSLHRTCPLTDDVVLFWLPFWLPLSVRWHRPARGQSNSFRGESGSGYTIGLAVAPAAILAAIMALLLGYVAWRRISKR